MYLVNLPIILGLQTTYYVIRRHVEEEFRDHLGFRQPRHDENQCIIEAAKPLQMSLHR